MAGSGIAATAEYPTQYRGRVGKEAGKTAVRLPCRVEMAAPEDSWDSPAWLARPVPAGGLPVLEVAAARAGRPAAEVSPVFGAGMALAGSAGPGGPVSA